MPSLESVLTDSSRAPSMLLRAPLPHNECALMPLRQLLLPCDSSRMSSATPVQSLEHIRILQEMFGRFRYGTLFLFACSFSACSVLDMSSFIGYSCQPFPWIHDQVLRSSRLCSWKLSCPCSYTSFSHHFRSKRKTRLLSRERLCASMILSLFILD